MSGVKHIARPRPVLKARGAPCEEWCAAGLGKTDMNVCVRHIASQLTQRRATTRSGCDACWRERRENDRDILGLTLHEFEVVLLHFAVRRTHSSQPQL